MKKSDFYARLCGRMRAARINAGLTQADVARGLGLSRPAVVCIERGGQSVAVDQLVRVAEMCGTTPVKLLGDEPMRPPGALDRLSVEQRRWVALIEEQS